MVTDVTIVQSDITIVVPWQLSTGSKHDYIFCNGPLVGILFEVLRIMTNTFVTVTVTESIGRPVDRTTLQRNEEDFMKKSIDKHSHYSSVKLINEHSEHQCNFEFKYVSPKEIETILNKLKHKKAPGCDGLPPKAAASVISVSLSSIVNIPIHQKDNQLEKIIVDQ